MPSPEEFPSPVGFPLPDEALAALANTGIHDGSPFSGDRELIVVADQGQLPSAGAEGPPAAPSALELFAAAEGVSVQRLFDDDEDEGVPEASGDAAPGEAAQRTVFAHVEAPDARLEELAARFRQQEGVAAAYIKPRAELARITRIPRRAESPAAPSDGEPPVNTMLPVTGAAPAATPDFLGRQGYLKPAPGGVDAEFAWTHAGGRGEGIRIIDLEWGWRFTHEDLRVNEVGVLAGTPDSDAAAEDHGTAVIGVIGGDRNSFGVTGISPEAEVGAVAFSMPTARAIRQAAQKLRRGDILLLEIHRAGPRHNFQGRNDQLGYIAVEWWPDDYEAIRFAVDRGIIVVEAAGNGAENLDDSIYDRNPPAPEGPFPASWSNPFRGGKRDSGAVVVGAGAPPPGTHGRNHGPDRSRLDFSNFGARVDAQGWGREVTTTGYGDLQAGGNRDRFYTDTFSGTSSASPVVVGVLACLQGIRAARGRPPLTPAQARAALRATGSPQQDAPGRPRTQRIGNRPDLRQLIGSAT